MPTPFAAPLRRHGVPRPRHRAALPPRQPPGAALAREAQLERLLVLGVRKLGGITVKLHALQAGVPDRLILLPGRPPQLVELKAEGEHPTPIQVHWHAKAAAIGHPVTTLVGRDEIIRWLAALEIARSRP